LNRDEALALVEEALARATTTSQQRARKKQASELAVIRFVIQLLGLGLFFAGSSILFAVFIGYKRPLRAMGIATNVETGILAMMMGAFIAWMTIWPGQPGTRRQQPPPPAPPRSMKQCSVCAEELLVDAEMCANCDEPLWRNWAPATTSRE